MAVTIAITGKFDPKEFKEAQASLHRLGQQGERANSRFGRAFAGIGGAFAKMGTIAGGIAIAEVGSQIIDFGKESADAFREAEAAQQRLSFAFQKFPALANVNIDALRRMNSALALKTKFDDDAIASGQAVLANFKLSGKQIQDTTPLLLDYAAATGQSTTDAAGKFGKALMGNTKALKSLGIAYKPTGDAAKDFANITALMQQKVGGFAEKEGASAAGQAEILANQFGEVKEQVGSYLVPALSKLTSWIITSVVPAIQTAASWLADNLGPVIQRVAEWVQTTMLPALRNLATMFMQNVWPAIQKVGAMIAENLSPIIGALAEFWTNTLLPGIQKAAPIFAKIVAVIGAIVAAVAVVVSWLLGKLIPVFLKVASFVAPIVIGAVGLIVDVIVGIGQAVYDAWQFVSKWFGKIVSFVTGLPDRIGKAASGMWDGIKDAFKGAVNWIIDRWNALHLQIGGQHIDLPFGASFDIPTIRLDTPDIPRLADGGIVRRRAGGVPAIIGEGRYDEAVVPLTPAMKRGMGGRSATLVIQPGAVRVEVKVGAGADTASVQQAVQQAVDTAVGRAVDKALDALAREVNAA